MKLTFRNRLDQPAPAGSAFTRIDLLASLFTILALFVVLTSALGKARRASPAFQCLNNATQLAAAVAMYSSDNHDYFPPNPDDGNTYPGYNWCPGLAGVGEMNQFDPQVLRTPVTSLLVPYIGTNVSLFRCAADTRLGLADGSAASVPGLHGKTIPCARSVSMNQGVGTLDPGFAYSFSHSGRPTLPVNGPWLDGTHMHMANHPYATFGKTTDFHAVSAGTIFLITEEDPLSINDGGLAVCATGTWCDYPAASHDYGCALSFCDGHVELHHWRGTTLGLTNSAAQQPASPSDPDYSWLVQHATAKLY